MRTLRLLFVIGAIIVANGVQAQYILTLNCSQMDPYLGKTFEVRVTEISSGKEVGRKTISSIDNSDFSIELYVLLNQRSYNVDFYIDVNENAGYDAPPTDHAWRRVVNNATQNSVINFVRDENYTNITFPDAFPYSTYNAIWGGKWMNLTFGSTDTIEAAINLTCDSIIGFFTTKGIFGIPTPMTFTYADTIPEGTGNSSDTIHYSPSAPWTGEVLIINEELHGALNLMGVGLNFTGTIGAKQILALYTVVVGGNPFANGYFYVREVEIQNSSPPLEIELTELEYVSCAGGNDGIISVIGVGGHDTFTYNWSNGEKSAVNDLLGAGEYSVTVTDIGGCSSEASFTITEPSPIILSVEIFEPSCYGGCDGFINLTVTGGTPGYIYHWGNTGLTTEDVGACADTYTVTVTDELGCTAFLTATVPNPDTMVFTILNIIHATDGQSNGFVEFGVTGGIPPYSYSINGIAFVVSNFFTNLPPGVYEGCVMDANGCITCVEFEILNLTATKDLTFNFLMYPNPANSYLKFEADVLLSVDILDIHGHLISKTENSMTHLILVEDFVPGLYIMRISDGTGVAYRKVVVE